MARKWKPRTPEQKARANALGKARRAADPEKARERDKRSYEKNKSKINARRAANRKDAKYGDRLREQEKERYWKNPESSKARQAKWRKKHPKEAKQRDANYRANNKDKIKLRDARRYASQEYKQWKTSYNSTYADRKRELAKSKRRANPEAFRERKRQWRKNNPDKMRAENQKRYYANPDKAIAARRKWRKEHPEEIRQYAKVGTHKRRARNKETEGNFTADDIKALLSKQGGKCATCRRKMTHEKGPNKATIDHVYPLVMRDKTSNAITNIAIMCSRCNSKKSTKDPYQWANENGLLFV